MRYSRLDLLLVPRRLGSRTLWIVAAVAVVLVSTVHANRVVAEPRGFDTVVDGPVQGGRGLPWFAAPFDVAAYGYSEREYFLSGTARTYGTALHEAPFTTRMVVYRPLDPDRFSGTVYVEWNNVTAQADAPAEFVWLRPKVLAEGDAYVQVTAQQAGVCGTLLVAPGPCTPMSLLGFDFARYGQLRHPGDDYSYSIFSHALHAVRNSTDVAPLEGLRPEVVVALGQSQSAGALDRYIRYGADDDAQLADGFLIDADVHGAIPEHYRVPTVHLWTEDSAQPRSPLPNPHHVVWSVAGGPHADRWTLGDLGGWLARSLQQQPARTRPQQEQVDATLGGYGELGTGPADCVVGSSFPRRYVVDAAAQALVDWISRGVPAPSAPPLTFTAVGQSLSNAPSLPALSGVLTEGQNIVGQIGAFAALARDSDGNAIGGVRLPVISVPVATYNGTSCSISGTSAMLPQSRLRELYPTHGDYVRLLLDATLAAVRERFLTKADAVDLMTRACNSAVPELGTTPVELQPPSCGQLYSAIN